MAGFTSKSEKVSMPPQPGKLANHLLTKRLNVEGYYQADTTSGLWRHKWHPVTFSLIVDDFGIAYVGKRHTKHLRSVLQKYYTITEDWNGMKYAGIDLVWDYTKRTCRLTVEGYIYNLLVKYGHVTLSKPQLSPHKHAPI